MVCKKSELVTAINSYATARASNDATLINLSASLLQNLLEPLSFSPEEDDPSSPAAASLAEEGEAVE